MRNVRKYSKDTHKSNSFFTKKQGNTPLMMPNDAKATQKRQDEADAAIAALLKDKKGDETTSSASGKRSGEKEIKKGSGIWHIRKPDDSIRMQAQFVFRVESHLLSQGITGYFAEIESYYLTHYTSLLQKDVSAHLVEQDDADSTPRLLGALTYLAKGNLKAEDPLFKIPAMVYLTKHLFFAPLAGALDAYKSEASEVSPFKSSFLSQKAAVPLWDIYKKGTPIQLLERGVHIEILQQALNDFYRNNPSSRFEPIPVNGVFDQATVSAFSIFQAELGIQREAEGVVSAETLQVLDSVNSSDETSSQKIIGSFALVYGQSLRKGNSKARFHSQADHKSGGRSLVLNEKLYIRRRVAPGWYEAIDRTGKVGYVDGSYLKMLNNIEDKGARLHYVTESSLEPIIDRYYKNAPKGTSGSTDYDRLHNRRLYAYAIHYLNQQTNEVVSIEADQGLFDTRNEYKRLGVMKNHWIWIPSETYVMRLYTERKIKSGSKRIDTTNVVKDTYQSFLQTLDKIIPIGVGFRIDKAIGLTVGFLGGDMEEGLYVYRKSKDVIFIQRRAMVAGGIDVGVGAGFFTGKKDKKKKKKSKVQVKMSVREKKREMQKKKQQQRKDGMKVGLGGEVGAQASAKLQMTGYQNFEFPFKNDWALLSVLAAASYSDVDSIKGYAIITILDALFGQNINPMNYLVETKGTLGGYVQGFGKAGIGSRLGKKDYKGAYKANEHADDRQGTVAYQTFDPQRIVAMFTTFGISMGMQGSVLAGMETHYLDSNGEETQAMNARYLDVVGLVEAKGSLDFFFSLLQQFGGGLKAKYRYDLQRQDKQPTFMGAGFYLTSGELDYYEGAGSEMEFFTNKSDLLNYLKKVVTKEKDFTWEDLVHTLKELNITKRTAIPFQWWTKGGGKLYGRRKKAFRTVKNLLKRKSSLQNVLDFNFFLTTEFSISTMQIIPFGELVVEALKKIKNREQPLRQIFQDIITFTETGQFPSYLKDIILFLFDDTVIKEARMHASAGLSFAGGGKVGTGLKLRVDAFGSAFATYEVNVTNTLQQEIKASQEQGRHLDVLKILFEGNEQAGESPE